MAVITSPRRHWLHPSHRTLAVAVLFLLLLGTARSARANPPGFSALDLVLTPDIWKVASEELSLSDEQQKLAQPLLDEYWKAAQALDKTAYDRFLDAGWRDVLKRDDELQDYLMSHRSPRLDQNEVQKEIEKKTQENADFESEIHFELFSVSLDGLQQADQLLEKLEYDLQDTAGLDDAQVAKLGRILRRETYLREDARQYRRKGDLRTRSTILELGSFMDLYQLIEAASEGEGELAQLKQALEQEKDAAQDDNKSAAPSLEETLEIYDLRVDDMLMQRFRAARKPPAKNPKMIFRDEDPEYADLKKKYAKSWSERYDTFALGAEMIRQLLAEKVGEDVAKAWQHRVNTYLCPLLTSGYWVSNLDEWITAQPNLTKEQIEQLQALKAQYEVDRQPIVERAIRAGINARKRGYDFFGTDPAQMQFARACMEYRKLAARTIMQMKPALTADQFTELKMNIYQHKAMPLGPDISAEALSAINVAHEDYAHPLGPPDEAWLERDRARLQKKLDEEYARKVNELNQK